MKKFYAIMAAAVAASGMASAQLPALTINEADLVPITGVKLSEAPAPMAPIKSVTADVKGQSIRKSASRADENEAVYGEYVFTYVDSESPFTTRFLTTKINADEKGGVTVSDLFYSDVETMPAEIVWEDVKMGNNTYNMPCLYIKGLSKGPTPYIIGDLNKDGVDETYYIALYDYAEGQLYGNDLKWAIDPESGEAIWWYGEDCGISYWTPGDDGYWNGYTMVPGAELFKKNAEMTAMFYAGQGEFEEATCPVWTYAYEGQYVDENQQPTGETFVGVFTAGWGGCGDVFRFISQPIEEDLYVAIANEQLGWTDAENYKYYFCDIEIGDDGEPTFAWTDNSGEGLVWMVATIGVNGDGNTVFSQDGMWTLFGDQGLVTYWQEGITVFDYYIGVGNGGGTEGVETIESNDNAPVEYYNLQGVKVANPTPGQLYIVKQGSKVSKVIR